MHVPPELPDVLPEAPLVLPELPDAPLVLPDAPLVLPELPDAPLVLPDAPLVPPPIGAPQAPDWHAPVPVHGCVEVAPLHVIDIDREPSKSSVHDPDPPPLPSTPETVARWPPREPEPCVPSMHLIPRPQLALWVTVHVVFVHAPLSRHEPL